MRYYARVLRHHIALLIALHSPSALAAVPYRLAGDVVPAAEAVRLRLDPAKTGYAGSVRVDLKVVRSVPSFRFHAERMKFDRLALSGPGGPVAVTSGREGDVVTVTAAAPLAPGAYALAIDFSNDFEGRSVGLYRVMHDGRAYAFTQFEAADARRAFPCWDEPSFKIPYEITLEVPGDLEGVTNTPIARQTEAGGWKTLAFRRTPPLPSYLLAIAVGPLEFTPIPGLRVPGRVVTPRGQRHLAGLAATLTPPVLQALERYFERPYPYEKLDLIAVPQFWPGAMENPAAVTFLDNILLVDPKSQTPAARRQLGETLAHELSHMWFGDLVTMAWWDDLWLNEAFANWMQSRISAQLFPEYHPEIEEVQSSLGVMATDARPATQAIRQPVTEPGQSMGQVGLSYNKGRAVLSMFERWIGRERFRRGVIDHLNRHAFGNATAADLWAALSRAAGPDIGPTIAPAMATFLDQPGVPLIDVQVLPGGKARLSQSRFTNFGVSAPPERWLVPVALKFSDGRTAQERTVLLDAPAKTFDLLAGRELAWIFPHAEATGYYRWRVAPAALLSLAQAAPRQLGVGERVAFLGDLAALLDAGTIHGDDYLRALERFTEDPEPEVLSALLGALRKVRLAFVDGPGMEGLFSSYVRYLLTPARRRFGLSRKPGEPEGVSLLRPQLLHWLGAWGNDPEVVRFAQAAARSYLKDPSAVDATTIEAVLEVAARHGDQALFDEYRRRFETTRVPAERAAFLAALGEFRAPALQAQALRYALEGPLRPDEILRIPRAQADTARGRELAYEWVTGHYAAVSSRVPPLFLPMLARVATGCEEGRVAAARRFFAQGGHEVQGTDRELAKVEEEVKDCVALRQREGGAVAKHIASLIGPM